MADTFQEDFFTRITNVHWPTGGGIFVAGSLSGTTAVSKDGYEWTNLGFLGFFDGGVGSGAFGGGVFLIVGNGLPDIGLAMASTDGFSWATVDQVADGGFEQASYSNSLFRYINDKGADQTEVRTVNAGADGLDNPLDWNSLNGSAVGPSNIRASLNNANGQITVVTKSEGGQTQTATSTVLPGRFAIALCYGGMGPEKAFISTVSIGGFPQNEEPSRTVFASRDALTWEPVFVMPASIPFGLVSTLLGGRPQALRKRKA